MDDRLVTRRRFLTGTGVVAAALVAGCSGDDGGPTGSPGTTSSATPTAPTTPATPTSSATSAVDPDTALVAAVRRDEQHLVADYRAAGRRHPRLRRDLAALQGHHEQHLDVLGGAAQRVRAGAGTRSARGAVKMLRGLEAQASGDRRRDALAARSGELARVLAAMAASSAQHVVLLERLVQVSGRGRR